MRQQVLGTLTIGQAPRRDLVPIIDRHVPSAVRRLHRGVLEAAAQAGAALKSGAAAALLLDCIGFTERHRAALARLDLPVILSNALVAKAVGALFGG